MNRIIETIEAKLYRQARVMNDLDLADPRDRDEFLALCRERQDLQRQRWDALKALDAPAVSR